MLAQLTWTLRQVPGIEALRVSIGGDVLDVPGDADVLPVTAGAEYDPTGVLASGDLFALRDGLLVGGQIDDLRPWTGRSAEQDQGVRAVAVTPDAVRVAGVTASGRVLVARVTSDGRAGPPGARAEATDLLAAGVGPDRTPLGGRPDRRRGAVVSVVRGGRARTVTVPGRHRRADPQPSPSPGTGPGWSRC